MQLTFTKGRSVNGNVAKRAEKIAKCFASTYLMRGCLDYLLHDNAICYKAMIITNICLKMLEFSLELPAIFERPGNHFLIPVIIHERRNQ